MGAGAGEEKERGRVVKRGEITFTQYLSIPTQGQGLIFKQVKIIIKSYTAECLLLALKTL